jgi:hypothetical protein
MKQTIAIQVNDEYVSETTHLVTLIVTNDSIPRTDHIEIKVSEKGVIIERWDAENVRFVNAYHVVFATDFNGVPNDDYADEPDGDADCVTNEGGVAVAAPEPQPADPESEMFARLAFDLPKFNSNE